MSFKNIYDKENKKCSRCQITKNISEFYKDRSTKSGYGSRCKECDTEQHRETSYKRLYGITKDDYNRMYEEQKGNCSICYRHFDLLCVDHDHCTNKVRSLLCNDCNYNLGRYHENKIVFQRFIDYIDLHNS